MDRNFRKPARDEADASPPSESWLFAQALLGKPIPNPASAQADARAKREHLEWLASFSTEHAAQLRRLQSEEAEARHQRELLQWLATFSTEHERELRRLQAREAEAIDAQASWEQFYEGYSASLAEWAEVDHPRTPKGTPDGGQWVRKGGASGSAGAADKSVPTSTSGQRKVVDQHTAPPGMLELATAWHETDDLLRRTRQDIETLPAEIAFRKAEVAKGGRFAYIFSQSLEKLTKDLETAKALVPQLEDQKRDLQREYTASGYDAFDYASWTPGETRVSGRGIEQVGRAVAASGSPAGLEPTDDEMTIAAVATSVLQLGRAALRRALTKAPATNPRIPERRLPFSDQHRSVNANRTLDSIESGGPFLFNRDGTPFGNWEGKLPKGNYREYTVETPGASHRATRRIIRDQDSGRTFYSDDHYNTFIQIDPSKR